ncbi:MAG: hypothetical protein IK133_09430 [Clostridia bacterium]|nr:hypothetical protein [Clostridia bacterium]
MMQTMGFGGFHMHVRTGMDTPYLNDEYMGFIHHCTEKAKVNGMLAYLYDEDRWPSGSAGGIITAEHPEFAKKQLLFTPFPYDPDHPNRPKESIPGYGNCGRRYENGILLAVYDVRLDEEGNLASWFHILPNNAESVSFPCDGSVRWYAYLESATDDPWFNDHPYTDTLNKDAIKAFIESTHEKYAHSIGGEFGHTIPSIFTDEPQFTHKSCLSYPQELKDVFIPWTDRLEKLFLERYSHSLLSDLPLLFWERPDGSCAQVRWRYQNLLADLFRDHYCRQIGQWCNAHGIALTGHINGEDRLDYQTGNVGDAMRCYPEFGIPGIDMLCDFHYYNTAKQAQSIVRQQGKPGMLSELYGVTGWDYDFRGYKLQGDWQAALGVTLRVPHLTWMTMKGEAKRDYPASIGYQSPWWDQFSLIEDHFARLNTVLTRGHAVCKVAVIHPVESYWLLWGPSAQTAAVRDQMEKRFAQLTEILLFGQIDFDFICEDLLPEQCPAASAPLKVGKMSYDTVIVPGCLTLRKSTVERLNAFRKAGGTVIFLGDCPPYLDAQLCDSVYSLYQASEKVSFDQTAILNSLEDNRLIDIRRPDGRRADNVLYQLRDDSNCRWLFLANGKNPVSPDVDSAPVYKITLKGAYSLTEYDTLTGKIRPYACEIRNGSTVFSMPWYIHSSLLLRLEPFSGTESICQPATDKPGTLIPYLLQPVSYTLEEPNMLLLDIAEWSLDGGCLQPAEELLRLDNLSRDRLGLPRRRKAIVQPYLLKKEATAHTLYLRFCIPSETELSSVCLALEEPEKTQIRWNGEPVCNVPAGWFVDKDIRTIVLGRLLKGENVLEIWQPIGHRTNLECFYLLGQFGVRVAGTVKTVVTLPDKLGFGDIVPQGLPFYTGNLQYHFDVSIPGDSLRIRIPHYRGALIRVSVDNEDKGAVVFSPYQLTVKNLTPGDHHITLRLYGNRQNGFGQLHHPQEIYFYQSPDSWRSAGDLWRYEYQFKPLGILKAPEISY